MKHAITITALMLAAGFANAKTICSINYNTGNDLVFDHPLYSAEVSTSKFVVLKRGAQVAEEVDMSQLNTLGALKVIDGATFFTMSKQANGLYGLTIGKVDLSKSENILPLEAMTVGAVTDQQPLSLILPPKFLAVSCISMK